jgi:quercetin dioxygenase-like cupin family protein
VVTAGRGTLAADGQTAPVGPGSVIYAPTGEPHHFTDLTSDLAAIVLFAPAEFSRAGPGR